MFSPRDFDLILVEVKGQRIEKRPRTGVDRIAGISLWGGFSFAVFVCFDV